MPLLDCARSDIRLYSTNFSISYEPTIPLSVRALVENRRRDAFNTALNNYNCACNLAARAAFGTAPTCLSTISPFLKINKVGILRIP